MRTLAFAIIFNIISILQANAALDIVACEPEWAALAQELAGEQANIFSATHALQDPHRIEARPSLIAKARRAQLLVCTGADLEAGWLPILQRESANPSIASGKPGYFAAADHVTMLEVPGKLDRADGDLHAQGNPHLHLDARNMLPLARALSQRLGELDAANAALYQTRLKNFSERWHSAITRWEKQAATLKGKNIVVQHRAYSYLENWLGLQRIAELEAKPGLEPGASHLAQLLGKLQNTQAGFILRSSYHDPKASQWLAERAHLPVVEIPFSVGGNAAAKDLFTLFDDIIARMLNAGARE